MSLLYRVALNIPTTANRVSSLDFSPCGSKLVAGTEDGNIIVWDTVTGSRYYPTLISPCIEGTGEGEGVQTSRSAVVIWLDKATFLTGFSDGYIATCRLERMSPQTNSSPQYRLHIARQQTHNHAITCLAYRREISCLAISGKQKLRLWIRKGLNKWDFWKTLASPTILEERAMFPLEITSCSWVSKTNLLVSYLHHGITIWDIDSQCPVRCINAGGIIYGGAWCEEVQKFAAINSLRKLNIYDTTPGQIWSPNSPCDVFAVKSIHSGSGVIVGGYGQAELVDIAESLVTQSLCHDVSLKSSSIINVIAAYQDQAEENFMIATAFDGACIIWRTEAGTKEE